MLSKNNFVLEIEKLCREKNCEYIDAIVLWCEKNKIEIEVVASLVKKDATLRSKVQAEAETLNFLKRSARLPIE